jgi:hypothetical protein
MSKSDEALKKEIDLSFKSSDITLILKWKLETVMDEANALAFAGYNPVVTMNIVMSLIKKEGSRKEHLCRLLVFGLIRGFGGGKTWEQIYSRTSADGATKLKEAVKSFSVILGKPKATTSITVPRLMSAFPLLTHKIYLQLLDGHVIREVPGYSGDLPDHWKYPGSPAAMPEDTWTEHKDNYIQYSIHCSKVWGREQSLEDAEKFANLAFHSQTSPMTHRSDSTD